MKALYFTSPVTPVGKAILVLEDANGWLYLKHLIDREGPATPFASVEELEVALGDKLTLIRTIII
ncbi:MAG: hypothetical protein HY052_04060 [Proteobacteria bacterium]|nr:hypothetical protein [Pseudomonadota bacterium]